MCVLLSTLSALLLLEVSPAGIRPAGAGDRTAVRELDAGQLNPNSGNSFAVWIGRVLFGDSAEFRPSWQVSVLRFVPERSQGI